MEEKIHRYYRISLVGVGPVFSISERKSLKEGEYHLEEEREIPLYELKQKEEHISSIKVPYKESYIANHVEIGGLKACNSFLHDNFFYDKEEKLLLYTNTFIYAKQRENTYFDLVTDLEIPRYAIENIERVVTFCDYMQLESNLEAILPYIERYKEHFISILVSNKNRQHAIARFQTKGGAVMPRQIVYKPQIEFSLQQLIQAKKEILASELPDRIETCVKRIGQKRK